MAQYFAPFGSTDPNASYVNGDPANGVQGSIPDCRGFESTQREIVNAIAGAGLTPSGSDLTQLVQALRSGVLTYTQDKSIAANAVILQPAFSYLTTPPAGSVFRFKATFAPTGDTVATISALAPIGVRMSGGGKVVPGAWSAGDMVTFDYDGQYLYFGGGGGSGGLLQTSNVVLNVPSALYPTIQAAVIAAGTMILPPNVSGVISVTAGWIEYLTPAAMNILLTHPYGQRWSLVGAPLLGAVPTAAQLAGKTNAQVLQLLRSIWQVEIRCTGVSGIELHSGVWNQVANILVTGDQTNSGGHYGIKVGDWSTNVGMGALGLLNVAVHGFGLDNIRAEQTSVIQCVNVISTWSSAHCFHVSHYSVLECNTGNLLGMFGQVGCMLQNAGQIAIDSASGIADLSYNSMQGLGSPDQGICNAFSCTAFRLQNNGTYGINMALNSVVALPSGGQTTFSGNALGDINLAYFSTVATYGCPLPGGSSPGRGSGFGNANAVVV